MAALTADRDTDRSGRGPINETMNYPVAAGKLIYAGALVVLSATGYAEPATAAAGKRVLGVAQAKADNSAGADGDITVDVRHGVFKFANGAGGDALAKTDAGQVCFASDDQTVNKTNGGGARSIAGTVVQVDADGVWVETRLTDGLISGQKLNEAVFTRTAIHAGSNGAGAVAAVGFKVGDKVLSAIDITNFANVTADFEATITVADQIQQTNAADLHLANIIFTVLAKS